MITLLSIVLTAFVAQAPLSPQAATPATVEGQVLKAGTNEPIANAVVELVSVQIPVVPAGQGAPAPQVQAPASMKTGIDGRFRLQNVPPGAYRVYATHPNGYSPSEYGQRGPMGLGMPLNLQSGQTVSGIALTMSPTASIAGRVVDGNGDPAAFVSMLAFRIVYRQGVRTVEVVQSVLTDDRGEYRLFWLVPGKYYLSALPIQARPYSLPLSFPTRVGGAVYLGTPVIALRSSEAGEVFEETYLPVYYPGTLDMRSSKPIILRPGENMRADFSVGVTATRTLQVNGTIADASGQPMRNARVSLAPRHAEGHSIVLPSTSSDANGNFSIRGVVPGAYYLYVTGQSESVLPALPVGPVSLGLSATVPLDVTNADIQNLKIQAVAGADIPYNLAMEPPPAAGSNPPDFVVSLVRDPNLAGAPPAVGGRSAPGGGVQFSGPGNLFGVGAGDYRVNVAPLPRTAYVKSIRLGTADVLRDGLHVSGPVRDQMQIVVSMNAGSLDGVVLDLNRQPFSNANVALLPSIDQRPGRLDLFKATVSAEDGKFHFNGLAPGEYKIFAFEDIPVGDWYDPVVMQTYETLGQLVQIEEAKTRAVDVRVIPAERTTP